MLLNLNDGSYSVGLGTIPNNKNELTEATHYIRNTLDTISCKWPRRGLRNSLRYWYKWQEREAASIKKDI